MREREESNKTSVTYNLSKHRRYFIPYPGLGMNDPKVIFSRLRFISELKVRKMIYNILFESTYERVKQTFDLHLG